MSTPWESVKKSGWIAGLADESVCPTLTCNGLHPRGASAFACQPIFSQTLRESVPDGFIGTLHAGS
jgi:hypothetical protein